MAASNPISLLGPPQILQQPTSSAAIPTDAGDPTDLMVSNFNTTVIHKNPPMGFTENFSPTFLSTGNPCLDFFFHVVPDTPPQTLIQRLELAWKHDPLKALKLICNLRGVRGTGKSDKEGTYTALLWLHNHHPKTLACNVASFADFGYYKDLLEILFLLLEGPNARKLAKYTHKSRKRGRDFGDYDEEYDDSLKTNEPRLNRQEKKIERTKRVVERFNRDPDFKFLHDRVSDLFAERLRSDMKMLNAGELKKISLAAKWCPSLDSSYDRITLLCEPIARKVFPRDEYAEYEGVEEAHYAYRVRDRLRKQVLVPLRKALQLPEVYTVANNWGSIPYSRVASVAMKSYSGKFLKHDRERFLEYLADVKTGKAKISAGALLPHDIIASLKRPHGRQVAELQWNRMVDDLSKKGKLNNCLAICDVSRSMEGIAMEVSVALGILVSELSDEPWKGKVITFSMEPKLHRIRGDSLTKKTKFVRYMDWGMNTNFQKVFDLLLQVAVDGKLRGDQMIKRLFVFSDMEFDDASENPWETDYQAIVRKFNEKGYGDCVPEIVFWNLRDSEATPVPANQPGVALVSGFSKNLLKIFLEEGGTSVLTAEAEAKARAESEAKARAEAETETEVGTDDDDEIYGGNFDPESVMEAAISGDEYQKLVVLD